MQEFIIVNKVQFGLSVTHCRAINLHTPPYVFSQARYRMLSEKVYYVSIIVLVSHRLAILISTLSITSLWSTLAFNLTLLSCIATLQWFLLTIDTWPICFPAYTFPWLCVWEDRIIILLAHDQDLASVLRHPIPAFPSEENINQKEIQWYPALHLSRARRCIFWTDSTQNWTDSGLCHCYHSAGFWVGWMLFPLILHNL